MLRPKPIHVLPLENYQLSIFFDNGEIRIFDASPLMVGDWFGQLKDKTIFKTVHIAGNTIEWINGQDVCPDDLYYLSEPIKEEPWEMFWELLSKKHSPITLSNFDNTESHNFLSQIPKGNKITPELLKYLIEGDTN